MANKQDLLLYSIAATDNEGGNPLHRLCASMRICYCTVCWCYMVQCKRSSIHMYLLYRHTLVTMSVRKKVKCEETMTVPHSTMESERCEDEANNRHIVQPKLLKNQNHYSLHTHKHSRMPDGRITVYYE